MRAVLLWVVVVALLTTGCGDSTTSPTTDSTTTTASEPPITTETFAGTLGVGATTFYPFTVSQAGAVTATLVSIGGDVVPSTVQVRLGIGTPEDTGCTAMTTSLVSSKSPVLSVTEDPGSYCVSITDVGNLFGIAAFEVTIAHP